MNDFMNGRRGADELTCALGGLSLLLALIGSLFTVQWLGIIALIVVAVALFRAFSPDSPARAHENDTYLELVSKIPFAARGPRTGAAGRAAANAEAAFDRKKRTAQKMWDNRKTTLYFKCKNCGQMLSVPRGKGKIRVTCPKCGTKVEKNS